MWLFTLAAVMASLFITPDTITTLLTQALALVIDFGIAWPLGPVCRIITALCIVLCSGWGMRREIWAFVRLATQPANVLTLYALLAIVPLVYLAGLLLPWGEVLAGAYLWLREARRWIPQQLIG